MTMNQTALIARALVRLSPSDSEENVREFLQGLVTQDLDAVALDQPQWSALLNAQGKVMFDFFLWADGDAILLDCEKDHAEALAKRLKLYRLRRKINIAILPIACRSA